MLSCLPLLLHLHLFLFVGCVYVHILISHTRISHCTAIASHTLRAHTNTYPMHIHTYMHTNTHTIIDVRIIECLFHLRCPMHFIFVPPITYTITHTTPSHHTTPPHRRLVDTAEEENGDSRRAMNYYKNGDNDNDKNDNNK